MILPGSKRSALPPEYATRLSIRGGQTIAGSSEKRKGFPPVPPVPSNVPLGRHRVLSKLADAHMIWYSPGYRNQSGWDLKPADSRMIVPCRRR
jgi:hypothetical protein